MKKGGKSRKGKGIFIEAMKHVPFFRLSLSLFSLGFSLYRFLTIPKVLHTTRGRRRRGKQIGCFSPAENEERANETLQLDKKVSAFFFSLPLLLPFLRWRRKSLLISTAEICFLISLPCFFFFWIQHHQARRGTIYRCERGDLPLPLSLLECYWFSILISSHTHTHLFFSFGLFFYWGRERGEEKQVSM